ncbi:unnamed protein product, partial [Brachionus calyciflorus]
MSRILEKKLPTLITPLLLRTKLNESCFNQNFRLLEANFGLENLNQYKNSHIEKALYFDIMNGVDSTKVYPRGLPKPEIFQDYVNKLGISNKHHLILYDRSPFGFFASSRTWWVFRVYGHEKISILNGGLNAWLKNCFNLSHQVEDFKSEDFRIKENFDLTRNYDDIIQNITSKKEQVVDARPREDFNKINPVIGLPNNIPNSVNLPYSELFDSSTGLIKNDQQLKELFDQEGVDLTKPLIASCNTSATA